LEIIDQVTNQKLSIDTPEQINLEYELAGIGSRFMALFVDLMIQAVAAIVILIFMWINTGLTFRLFRSGSTWMLALTVLLIFGVQWGYFAVFEILWKGQTPGKRQAGIRVINESGREASVYEAVARNLLRVIDALPGPYAVGAIVMFLSPQSKRIGDYVAGTVVVHDRKIEDEAIFFNTRSDDAADAINCAELSTEDLHIMETFLQRRLDLPFEVRQKTAKRLASHFREKCSVPEGTHTDNENLLETLVRGFRRSGRLRPR
jgi:uncharacterized RDD family membrane protein YckC